MPSILRLSLFITFICSNLSLHLSYVCWLSWIRALLLLHKMLYMNVMWLKILDLSETFWLNICNRLSLRSNRLWAEILTFQVQNRAINCWRKRIECSRVRHTELQSFLYCSLNWFIMTKSLPLSIDWIYATSWKIALLNEPLPVDLIFILLTRILLCDLENFNELSHRKPCSLAW